LDLKLPELGFKPAGQTHQLARLPQLSRMDKHASAVDPHQTILVRLQRLRLADIADAGVRKSRVVHARVEPNFHRAQVCNFLELEDLRAPQVDTIEGVPGDVLPHDGTGADEENLTAPDVR